MCRVGDPTFVEVGDGEFIKDYGEAVVCRLIIAPGTTESLAAEVLCKDIDVVFERFGFDYRPTPFEPRAVERTRHAR